MSSVSYDPHAAQDPYAASDDDGELAETEYVGVLGGGTALYYDETTGSFLEGDADGQGGVRLERFEDYEVGAEDRLGAVLETIGEDLGWESLSEFARDHLEDPSSDR